MTARSARADGETTFPRRCHPFLEMVPAAWGAAGARLTAILAALWAAAVAGSGNGGWGCGRLKFLREFPGGVLTLGNVSSASERTGY